MTYTLCGIARRTRTLWYRLYFKFVRCECRRTTTHGRSEGREREMESTVSRLD